TLEERRRPEIIGGSRKKRIAGGSGTTPAEINQLLAQFRQMQGMMKQLSRGLPGMAGMPRGGLSNALGGALGGLGGGLPSLPAMGAGAPAAPQPVAAATPASNRQHHKARKKKKRR